MALAVRVLAVTIDVRHTFHSLAGLAAVFARRDHATANRVCTLLGIRSVHLISPLPLSLRADRATTSKPSGVKGLSYKIAIDRPIPLGYYSPARPDSIYKGTHGRHAMPQMPFAGRTLQRRIELLLHAFARVWERYTLRYVSFYVLLHYSRFYGNVPSLT